MVFNPIIHKMNTINYFDDLTCLINFGKSDVDLLEFNLLNSNAATALTALKDLYLITVENVARANAADYEHIIDYIKANEIINKAIYYVNMIYDTYCYTFTKIQDAAYKRYLNAVKREEVTDEDTKEFHENIVKFDKYANQYVKPISSYKIKVDEELRKRCRPLY